MIFLAWQFLGLDFQLEQFGVFRMCCLATRAKISFLVAFLSETIPLLPATHIRCKAIEDLTEYLIPLQTGTSRRILDLATRIWGSTTAIEVLEHSQEVFPEAEFTDLIRWVQLHYPLVFLAFQHRVISGAVVSSFSDLEATNCS